MIKLARNASRLDELPPCGSCHGIASIPDVEQPRSGLVQIMAHEVLACTEIRPA